MQGCGKFIDKPAFIGGEQGAGIVLRFFAFVREFQGLDFFEQFLAPAFFQVFPEGCEF